VEVRGWDAGQEQGFSYRAEASRSPGYAASLASTGLSQVGASASERVIHAEGQVRSVEEARTLAEAVLAQQRRSLFVADGSAVGNPDLRVGSSVRLLNMWRFSADYVVDSARHDIGPSGYRTTFRMRQHL
jgi:phage protein D